MERQATLLNTRNMTDTQFVEWLRGFTEGVHHYNLSPKQWDYLKEKLNTVKSYNQTTVPYTLQEGWVTNIA